MSELFYEKISKAMHLLDLGRYKEALPLFQDCVVKDGWRTISFQGLFECYVNLDQNNHAKEIANQAIEKYPDNPDCVVLSAVLASQNDKPKRAIKFAEIAISLDPLHGQALTLLSLNYIRIRQLTKAAVFLRTLKELDPESSETYYLRALYAVEKRKNLKAFAIVEEGLGKYPENQDMKSMYLQLSVATKSNVHDIETLAYENLLKDPTNEFAKNSLLQILKNRNGLLRFFVGNSFNRVTIEWTFWRVIVMVFLWKASLFWGGFALLYLMVSWYGGVLYNTIIRLHRKYKLLLNQNDVNQSNLFLGGHLIIGIVILSILIIGIEIPMYQVILIFILYLMIAISWFEIQSKFGKIACVMTGILLLGPLIETFHDPVLSSVAAVFFLLVYAFMFTLNLLFK